MSNRSMPHDPNNSLTAQDIVKAAVMASSPVSISSTLEKHNPDSPQSLGSVFETAMELADVLDAPWEEVTESMKGSLAYFPGCRYFTTARPGTMGVVDLVDFPSATKVVLRDPKGNLGSYGGFLQAELQVCLTDLPKTNLTTLILGPEDEGSKKLIFYTIHPGPAMPLSRVDKEKLKDQVVTVHQAVALGFRYALIHILRESVKEV